MPVKIYRRRLEQLRARADAIMRSQGVAVAIEKHGWRYVVIAQHGVLGPDGELVRAVAAGGTPLDFKQALAYLEGIDDGYTLATWRTQNPERTPHAS